MHRACLRSAAALTPPPVGLVLWALPGGLRDDTRTLGIFDRMDDGSVAPTWGQPAWLVERAAELSWLARADGVDADAWVRRSPLCRDVDPDAVDAWLANVAAYMLAAADDPVWAGGSPLVRVHQRRWARTFLDWIATRRGWA